MSKTLLLTLPLVGMSFFFMWIGNWKCQNRMDAIKEENRINVTIIAIDRYATRNFGTLDFWINGARESVNICPHCGVNFKIGEQIPVYYNPKNDLYVLENDGLENEGVFSFYAGEFLLIVIAIYWFWELYFWKIVYWFKLKKSGRK